MSGEAKQFSVGSKVRIDKIDERTSYTANHDRYRDQEGTVVVVDPSDDTLRITIGDKSLWFRAVGVILLHVAPRAASDSRCSCNGPAKTVMILFQPVQVCTVCHNEKP